MLAQAVESYLAVRHACGFDLKTQGYLLRSFAAFSDARGKQHVCSEIALEWAGLAKSIHERAHRLKQVIHFSKYVRAEDQCHELPSDFFGSDHRDRPIPYIFSPENIVRFVHAAAQTVHNPFLKKTYCTLFALLACTGLRVTEATRLHFEDITPDGIIIRKSKFRKNRLVPLHETTRAELERYFEYRLSYAPFNNHVFVSLGGEPLRIANIERIFKSAADIIGLRRGDRRPTPHSLRYPNLNKIQTFLKKC
jgi:integrase